MNKNSIDSIAKQMLSIEFAISQFAATCPSNTNLTHLISHYKLKTTDHIFGGIGHI